MQHYIEVGYGLLSNKINTSEFENLKNALESNPPPKSSSLVFDLQGFSDDTAGDPLHKWSAFVVKKGKSLDCSGKADTQASLIKKLDSCVPSEKQLIEIRIWLDSVSLTSLFPLLGPIVYSYEA